MWMFAVLGIAMSTPLPQSTMKEVRSLSGKQLPAYSLPEATRKSYETLLARAKESYDADPHNLELYIWVGRRLGYLGRFHEAIAWYEAGLKKGFADRSAAPKLLRHLTHRYITVRDFTKANVAGLQGFDLIFSKEQPVPDEIEPDGLPNDRNQPIGTLHSNLLYHWGLAAYLQRRDFTAEWVFRRALDKSNPDRLVSATYWYVLTLARQKEHDLVAKALEPIRADLDVFENQSYHRLLLHFKGELAESDLLKGPLSGNDKPTIWYGVAAWRMATGRREEGTALLKEIVKLDTWAAFGYIAAEAELHYLNSQR